MNKEKGIVNLVNKFKILFLLVILAFFIRLYRIDVIRLTHDEMSIGYNAYSVLKTGRDEWGRLLPLDFEAFGDHKLPAYIYSAVPFIALFGLTELAVKLPSILAGTILVGLVYLLAKQLTKDQLTPLLAAGIAAFSPVTIHLSRLALEANLALVILAAALWLISKIFKLRISTRDESPFGRKDEGLIIASLSAGLLLSLTLYTYTAYRLLIPIFLLAVSYLAWRQKKLKSLKLIWLSFLIALIPLLPSLIVQKGTARFAQISIFSSSGVVDSINDRRAFCYLTGPKILGYACKFVYNKPVAYLQVFTQAYFHSLSPDFLFLSGDQHAYLSNPRFGEFFAILIPFYLIGLFVLFRRQDELARLLIFLFFLAPIPGALSGEAQIVRLSPVIIPVMLMIALGIEASREWLAKQKTWKLLNYSVHSVCLVIFAFLTFSLLISTYYIYPFKYDENFYRLSKSLVSFIKANRAEYDLIYVNDKFADAHILFAFYEKIDPAWYQTNIIRNSVDSYGFSHAQQLGKLTFGPQNPESFLCDESQKVLYVGENYLIGEHVTKFKNFSGVHVQAEVIDIQLWRHSLKSNKEFDKFCP